MAPERAARARRLETEAFLRRGAGLPETVRFVIRRLAPAVGAGRIAASVAARLAGTPLDRGLPGNVTVEMGLELARLARRVPAAWTADELDARLARREAPADLQAAWDAWIERYGHRGPREIDPAAPRYREEPGLVLRQLVALRDAPPTGDPAAQREAAYAAARARLGPLQRIALDAAYRVLVALGGFRELPKFALVRAIDGVRRRAIAEGRAFGEALRKPWPRLFDSRGRIVRPPPLRAREGELAGEGVSPGVARGPVKVLHAPDEKPVAPGDVLVARATDPGWTPLFVNAAAVVLEIGGTLQHGALVAREYGKPCVVGIERATERLADGAIVEVDGAAGIVRRR
jgi:pyruvate,water dikinase